MIRPDLSAIRPLLCIPVVLVLAGPMWNPARAQPIDVSAGDLQLPVGSEGVIGISLSSTADVRAIDLDVRWDGSLAEFVSVQLGQAFETWLVEVNELQQGWIRLALVGTDVAESPDPRAILISVASDARTGSSAIQVLNVTLYDEQIEPLTWTAESGLLEVESVIGQEVASIGSVKARY